MKKQVVVIGLGRFGTELAKTLSRMGHDVMAIDTEEAKVQSIASEVARAVRGDATSEATLAELGVRNFDVAIVAVGSQVQVSVLATILMKRLGIPYVIARANNELHGAILDKIGADRVVYPELEMGAEIAHVVNLRDVLDYIPLPGRYGVSKLAAPAHFAGRTLSSIGFGHKGRFGISVLLIQREQELIIMPGLAELVKEGDVLVVCGADNKLEELLASSQSS